MLKMKVKIGFTKPLEDILQEGEMSRKNCARFWGGWDTEKGGISMHAKGRGSGLTACGRREPRPGAF